MRQAPHESEYVRFITYLRMIMSENRWPLFGIMLLFDDLFVTFRDRVVIIMLILRA
jgi:hypothetical protein